MIRFLHPRPTTIEKRQITINSQTISYILKRSARAKQIRLEIKRDTGLTVVVPRSYGLNQLTSFLEAKQSWILGNLAKCEEIQSLYAGKELKNGDTIPYLGRNLKLVIQENHRNASNVKLVQDILIVSLRPGNGRLNIALERWYRMQAAELMKKKVDELSARLGISYTRLTIRGQKTRWGSCSRKGNLSFNWKLLMAPEPVIDYVIIHELAHLKEMNHTKRFWAIVDEYCPQWRKYRKWLRDFNIHLCDSSFLSLDGRGLRACPELVEG